MSKRADDISQITKYLSGKLDARSMHELERRALDDPFLADALEGYGQKPGDSQADIAELSNRLQSRINAPVRRLIPWVQLSAAAAILLVIGVGVWFVANNKTDRPRQQVAAVTKSKAEERSPVISSPTSPVPGSTTDTALFAPKKNALAQNPAPVSSQPPRIADLQTSTTAKAPITNDSIGVAKPADVVAAAQYNKPQPAADANVANADKKAPNISLNEIVVENNATFKKSAVPPASGLKSTPKMSQETLLTSKVEGLSIKPANRTLTGIVTSAYGSDPLVGAVVRIAGSNFGVVTDANGRFVMHDVPEKKTLVVGYIGYDTKQVKLNGRDSINVALAPAGSALREVSIINDHKAKNILNPTKAAHPSAGWKALDDYLSKNATSTDGKTGKVSVSFTVDKQGNLSNFKILQSLSDAADKKAIDLLKNGPGWAGNADGKQQDVTLDVVFH